MGARDPRIDTYIANSAEFARPILSHLREQVHRACPEVKETMKWSMPHFMYHGMLCGMAAFKQHCTFGFWKGALIVGGNDGRAEKAMGQFGRITALKELPSNRELAGYIKSAMKLNEEQVKLPKPKRASKPPLRVPAYLAAALARNRKAQATFTGFAPSKRREYVEWLTEAKTESTRQRRLETALAWLAEGKSRNWKYENC